MTVPHARQAERDLAGVAVASVFGAQLVGDGVNIIDIYDPRVGHIIEAARTIPEDLVVDLSGVETGVVIGEHVIARGMAFTGAALDRIIAVANATDQSPVRVAELVADLPCRPSRAFVEQLVAEVEDAAKRRALLVAMADAEMMVTAGVPLSEAVISVLELVVS